MTETAFWKTKPLNKMTRQEWESLCDGCGLCCLVRFQDEDTEEVVTSNIACKYLDLELCSCKDYLNRHENVPDCIKVTPQNIAELTWLPESCAYRVVYRGEDLAPWHHLLCGDKNKVHEEGISWKDELISEEDVDINDYLENVIQEEGENE